MFIIRKKLLVYVHEIYKDGIMVLMQNFLLCDSCLHLLGFQHVSNYDIPLLLLFYRTAAC